MGVLRFIKKNSIDLFFYYFTGARVDGALQWAGRSRIPLKEFPRSEAIPIEITGSHIIYDSADILRQWKVTVKGTLTLKNNSKNYAYNVILLNAGDLFDTYDSIPKQTSIAPNGKLEIKVSFIQYLAAHSGQETETLPDIPADKENRYLLIQYENERGTKLLTKFLISFSVSQNIYTYT